MVVATCTDITGKANAHSQFSDNLQANHPCVLVKLIHSPILIMPCYYIRQTGVLRAMTFEVFTSSFPGIHTIAPVTAIYDGSDRQGCTYAVKSKTTSDQHTKHT